MEITKSLAYFLDSRLVCVQFLNGKIVYGVCGGQQRDGEITIKKPCMDFGELKFTLEHHGQNEIKRLTLCDDLYTVYLLNLALKCSKRVRRALEAFLK